MGYQVDMAVRTCEMWTPSQVRQNAIHDQTASPADDATGTLVRQDTTPAKLRSPSKERLALLVPVASIVFGAKLVVIGLLGSPTPFLDQWEGEAAKLYAPYQRGTLSFADIMAPHNEHCILPTRVISLIHLEMAGEWDTRLEMIFGAIVHTALITLLTALLLPLVTRRRRLLTACFIAILFALPIGYENTLWGFQSQLYFTLLFGVASLAAIATARPFSLRWIGGLAAGLLSSLSFATGVATLLTAGILVSLQLATNTRKHSRPEFAAVTVILTSAAAVTLLVASTTVPNSNPRTLVQGFLMLVTPAVVGLVPAIGYCLHVVVNRPETSDRAWIVVGLTGWIPIQLLLIAYGRGVVFAVRYSDIILLIYPVGLVAVFALSDIASESRFGRYATQGAVTWLFVVIAVLGAAGGYVSALGAIDWNKAAHQQTVNLRTYFATGNVDQLRAKGAHNFDLSFRHSERQAEILRDPQVRAILPPDIRPSDADNATARSRMWLKGALAGHTASAVHFLLSTGPILLGVGVSLFFAIAARRVLSGEPA
ncbi:hypothetical protein GAN17_11005 [Mycobacterium kubicae]|uniref:hypothetical protein n=1 Tax=Mycobacterium kubicae TaxID=120959 RepID=UPI001640E285|nr:hypothetical protein [Mycobacterium kubicae]QNI06765.1 hypothetical protein GAN17_11005 [Mycobacterium kubicae]